MTIPRAHIERIMRQAGAERVAEGAIDELQHSVQEIGDEVAADAVQIAKEDGRDDVTLANIKKALEV